MTQGVATSAAVDEPLELSAPIARELAGRLCGHDPLSGSTCAWYHGFWQYVRLLGLGASPSVHAARLLPALRSLARTGSHQRLLISGAADYSMLATVVTAYSAEQARLRPVVVDMCATPLYMCRWYADRIHCEIATVASDIRSVAVTEPVDVVCTHAFLGYFSPADRGPLIAKWASLLRPGGRIVTVQRIRSHADSAVVRFTPHEKAAFVTRIEGAARDNEGLDDATRAWLSDAARNYAERFWTYPVASKDELSHLFEDAACVVDVLDVVVPEDQDVQQPSGPTIPARAEYAFVIATRR